MSIRIITADERLSVAENKTSLAIFGPPGVGKTTLLTTLPAEETVCLDLEAGLKSVQDWRGDSIPVRSFTDFRDQAVLIVGPDPAQHPQSWYGTERHAWLQAEHRESGLEEFLASKRIIFVDSITDLTHQAMTWARQQPEAFSERTGKADVRGAYGLLGREVIQALKHLQHARGKTVIFVGVLEKVTDEFGAVTWQPQMEGSKAGRELPGIVDQVVSMQFFAPVRCPAPPGGRRGLGRAGASRGRHGKAAAQGLATPRSRTSIRWWPRAAPVCWRAHASWW